MILNELFVAVYVSLCVVRETNFCASQGQTADQCARSSISSDICNMEIIQEKGFSPSAD
jgi:hypothetical protein